MIVAGNSDARPVSVNQTLALVFSEDLGLSDLEDKLRARIGCIGMLTSGPARWAESPGQLAVRKHELTVDDHAIRPRLVSSHAPTVVAATNRREAKSPEMNTIPSPRGQTGEAKE